MAENEISELVVAMKPDGIAETTDGLNTVQEKTEETADTMQEQSEEADTFADKFQGSMQVAVSALAIGAGGLLSQVPVIGEAMSGLFALVDAVAFQMDQVLRPVISPITNLLFNMSGAVGNLNGPMGTLVGIVGTLAATLAGMVATVAAVNAVLGTSFSVISGLTVVAGTVSGAFATLAAAVGLPVAAVVALVAAVGLLVAVLATDFLGIRTKTINALKDMWGWVKTLDQAFEDLAISTIGGVSSAASWLNTDGKKRLKNAINSIVDAMETAFSEPTELGEKLRDGLPTAAAMKDHGENLMDALADGIDKGKKKVGKSSKNAGDKIKDFLGVESNTKMGPLSNIESWPVNMANELARIDEQPQIKQASLNAAEQLKPDSSLSNAQFATPRNGTSVLEVDGKVLGEVTGRRQREGTAVRNIDG